MVVGGCVVTALGVNEGAGVGVGVWGAVVGMSVVGEGVDSVMVG